LTSSATLLNAGGKRQQWRRLFGTARPAAQEQPSIPDTVFAAKPTAFENFEYFTCFENMIGCAKRRRQPMPQRQIAPIIPSNQDASLAKAARVALEASKAPDDALHVQIKAPGQKATALDLPPIVTRLLMDILRETAAGKAVSLASVDAEITTQEAAALLNVSRPYLVGMIDKGLLPARMVGNQRRLPLQDVLAYKVDNRAKRCAVLAELAAHDQDLGLE